jgi:hypothetical protein
MFPVTGSGMMKLIRSCCLWGGEKMIGASLQDCHNEESREKIQRVVDLIGYYEKHEFRNPETMKRYCGKSEQNIFGLQAGHTF